MGKQRLRTQFAMLARLAGFTGLGLLSLAACGGSATAPVQGPQTTKIAETPKTTLDVAAAEPVENTPDEVMPTKIGSLFQFVAKDAPLIVNVPQLDKLLAALDAEATEAIMKELREGVSKKSAVDANLLKDLISSFQGAVLFADPAKKDASADETAEAACVAAKFGDAKPVEAALASKGVERMGKTRFQITNESKKETIQGAWLADSGVLLACLSKDAFSSALSVANGAKPSFSSSPLFAPERANDFFVSADLNILGNKIGNKAEPGSRFYAGLTAQNGALALDLRLAAYGPDFPPIGSILEAAPQNLVGKMPKGTASALGFSLKRMPGKNIFDLLDLVDRAGRNRTLEQLESALYQFGLRLNDIDAVLGDEVAIGIYRDPKFKVSIEQDKDLAHTVVIVAIETKDEAIQKKFWSTLTTLAKEKDKKNKELTIKGDSIESNDAKDKKLTRLESRKGMLLLGVGDKSLVKEALAKVGKDKETLGATPTFVDARSHEKPTMHALGYLDGAVVNALFGTEATTTKISDATSFLTLQLGPTDRGLELALGGNGATEVLGMLSRIAILSVNQYTANAKAADARMNVRFISRYAQRAYERESIDEKGKPTHNLCKSALPVPTFIPKNTTYKTTFSNGGDWDSGDDTTGWKCLQFFMGEQIRYQFEYRQGNNYKGPKRGGPNPGKEGFEVSAEGDLDGDGKTSLFTLTGKITAGKLILDKDVFESDPTE